MFEEEAKEYRKENLCKKCNNHCKEGMCTCSECKIKTFKDGAEFGYNKANEWHEIESKVIPKREISKQYMPKNKEKVLLKYHFSGDDEIHISDGYYDAYSSEFHVANNPTFRIVCVIAWREFPKKENE